MHWTGRVNPRLNNHDRAWSYKETEIKSDTV